MTRPGKVAPFKSDAGPRAHYVYKYVPKDEFQKLACLQISRFMKKLRSLEADLMELDAYIQLDWRWGKKSQKLTVCPIFQGTTAEDFADDFEPPA